MVRSKFVYFLEMNSCVFQESQCSFFVIFERSNADLERSNISIHTAMAGRRMHQKTSLIERIVLPGLKRGWGVWYVWQMCTPQVSQLPEYFHNRKEPVLPIAFLFQLIEISWISSLFLVASAVSTYTRSKKCDWILSVSFVVFIHQKIKDNHLPTRLKQDIDYPVVEFKKMSISHVNLNIACALHLKECYEVMKMLLLKINYHAHCWSICSDFKVIAIQLGLKTGYTKYCCFLCYWNNHAREKHQTVKVWSERDSFEPAKETSLKTL